MAETTLYRVTFLNRNEVYEIYAREVGQAGMYGFVEVADPVFGEKSEVIIDPTEERLRAEFKGVRRFYIPVHSVVRIDQVEKRGPARVTAMDDSKGGTVTPFNPGMPPRGK